MNGLIFLLGIILGFIAGSIVSFLLIQRRIRWERSPRREIENLISEFNRYYVTRRESNSQ